MSTIRIGRFGRGVSGDREVNFDRATAKTTPASDQTRPQFCIELTGKHRITQIYAASAQAHERLAKIVAAGAPTSRIVPGEEVLGIHTKIPASGWPFESEDRAWVVRAPQYIITYAPASMPDKPAPTYPFPGERGVEVIAPGQKARFQPYQSLDQIGLKKCTVMLTFKRAKAEISELVVVTANEVLAARLLTSIVRKTSRRLMINESVIGISMVLADGTQQKLGILTTGPQTTAAK